MNGLIDIHTHILPNVDDGAQSVMEAVKLVRQAYNDGTRALFLTSHYRGKYRENPTVWLREMFDTLVAALKEEGVDMALYLGREVHYQSGVMETILPGSVMTMGDSRYVLLEFMPGSTAGQVCMAVEETVMHGFIPIIAHAERYDIFRKQKDLAREVCGAGALIQLNADSVMGKQGFFIKRYCASLLEAELVHFVASDAHDSQSRPPLLQNCYDAVRRKYGREYALKLFRDDPRAVIENVEI